MLELLIKKSIIERGEVEWMANWTFTDQIPMGFFDVLGDGEKGSLGFMDMLGSQDYVPSLFDDLFQAAPPLMPQLPSPASTVVNTPATPNSCSISSSSTEVANDDQKVDEKEEKDQEKITKKE